MAHVTYHQGPCIPCMLKSKDHAEPAPFFASPRGFGPVLHRTDPSPGPGELTLMALALGKLVPPITMGRGVLILMTGLQESWLPPLPEGSGPNRGLTDQLYYYLSQYPVL